jgi:glutaredoxin
MKKTKMIMKSMFLMLFFVNFGVYAQITVYSMTGCGRCGYAKKTLKKNGVIFTEKNTTDNDKNSSEMFALLPEGGSVMMPVITVDKKLYYDIEDLEATIDEISENYKKTNTITAPNTPQKSNQTATTNIPTKNPFDIHTPPQWTKEQKEKAYTTATTKYLSQDEQEIIYLMNLARMDGNLFAKTYLSPYVAQEGMSTTSPYVKSLYLDLAKVKDLKPFNPSEKLSKSAKYHAIDMGKTGGIGHDSSDGTGCFERIDKYSSGGNMKAENCSYGNLDPLGVVMQLLIDDGVPSKGHRKNILNGGMGVVGVSVQPHKEYQSNCVQDFADRE